MVNATGYDVHINANTDNLNLGVIKASGDPVFTSMGEITISNTLGATGGDALTLIAGTDIVMDTTQGAGNNGLDTTNPIGGNGGQLNLIAGAKFTPFMDASPALSNVKVTGASATGGKIDLTAASNNISSINTSSTNGNGGDITFIAYKGSSPDSGTINVPTSVTINTSAQATAGR